MAGRVENASSVRRRDWSEEDKRRFVAETYGPGMSVSAAAQRHDLSPGLRPG